MPAKIPIRKPAKGTRKQVHFSKMNLVQSVHFPPAPELSMGSFSPASSGGMLITPPLYTRGLPGPTPYGFQISPSKSTPHLHLRPHQFLRVSSSPPITYDLTQPTSALYSPHFGIPRATLCEPATSPSVQMLTIISPRFPWAITVSPSTYHYVSVIDVLDGIYRALRVGVTSHEFHAPPTDRGRVSQAYEARCRRIRSQREHQQEKSRGVRRVDFLMEHTKFRGLSPAPGTDAWVLNTA